MVLIEKVNVVYASVPLLNAFEHIAKYELYVTNVKIELFCTTLGVDILLEKKTWTRLSRMEKWR